MTLQPAVVVCCACSTQHFLPKDVANVTCCDRKVTRNNPLSANCGTFRCGQDRIRPRSRKGVHCDGKMCLAKNACKNRTEEPLPKASLKKHEHKDAGGKRDRRDGKGNLKPGCDLKRFRCITPHCHTIFRGKVGATCPGCGTKVTLGNISQFRKNVP